MSKQFFVDNKANAGGASSDVSARIAYINDRAYEIQDGDTILTLNAR